MTNFLDESPNFPRWGAKVPRRGGYSPCPLWRHPWFRVVSSNLFRSLLFISCAHSVGMSSLECSWPFSSLFSLVNHSEPRFHNSQIGRCHSSRLNICWVVASWTIIPRSDCGKLSNFVDPVLDELFPFLLKLRYPIKRDFRIPPACRRL